MLEAVLLFIAVIFMFRVVFTDEWQAHFAVKIILFFISVPGITIFWVLTVRYVLGDVYL